MENMDRLPFKWLLDEFKNFKVPAVHYAMGVDSYGGAKSFCLMRFVDGVGEVILQKTIKETEFRANKSEFEEEVENLCKYFNAEKFEENEA